jgi:sec-independent protein translocase protein TatB
MFDIGFQEIVLIGLIGLVVVGPARLPKLAKTVGLYVNKMRRFVTDVRSDVERELHAEDLRQSLGSNSEFGELKNVMNEARAGLDEVRSTVADTREEFAAATSTPADWSNPDVEPAIGAEHSAGTDAGEAGTGLPTTTNPAAEVNAADAVVQSSSDSVVRPDSEALATSSDAVAADSAALNSSPGASLQSEAEMALDDNDNNEPTVFDTELAAKREAGGKID